MALTEHWRDAAERQAHAVGRHQLIVGGLTKSAIENRCRRGLLHPQHPGVFSIGRPDLDDYGRAWAAFLATRGRRREGHMRALTGRSSAALLGVLPFPIVHEVAVLDAEIRVAGVMTLRTRELDARDRVVDARGLVSTAWPRMLLDLAPTASVALLETTLSNLADAGILDLAALDARLARAPGRATRKIARAVEPYRGLSPGEHRSLLERLADRTLVGSGLPRPEINAPLLLPDGREILVDLLYREARVAIEVDGRTWHARAAAFERDRVRDRQLALLGYLSPRFVWWEVRRSPQIVARDVRPLLAR